LRGFFLPASLFIHPLATPAAGKKETGMGKLKPLTRYWFDREKGEVVAICESRKPPREGLSLVVTNIYGEIAHETHA
jgi:hypothetical protein